MSQIVNTLPSLPSDMPYKDYFIYHVNGTGTYRINNFEYIESDVLDSNNHIRYGNCVVYDYDRTSDSWVYNSSWSPGESYSDFNLFTLIASTVDIYNSDGSIYCSATKENYFTDTISLISTSITSSTLTSALNDTKFIFPILVAALVAIIAFRKAWNFLKGAIRGA